MSSHVADGMSYPRAVVELAKLRITAAVTLTTATGYFLAARRLEWAIWLPLLGMFVLASGSAALNQWQERNIDARMRRTRDRPIPSGRIDSSSALFVALLLILVGFYCLSCMTVNAHLALILGGIGVVWYNGVYTYLKRVTAFAVVPGALIGAIPPCVGYVSAGGGLYDPGILLVALFFFLWQIPHFWLLLLMVGGDYRMAGLPSVTEKLTQAQLARISFMWLLATAASALAFPALSHVNMRFPWSLTLVAASLWLAAMATKMLGAVGRGDAGPSIRRAFWRVNMFALLVMICLSMGALGVFV